MKKFVLLFASIFIFSLNGFSQIVTTNPAFITESSGTIEIIFNADQGTGGLRDYTGTVYAHTGLITCESRNDSDWRYVLSEWGENTEQTRLTPLGNNQWRFVISPSIRDFYGVPAGERVLRLAFVFRSAEPDTQGRFLEGKDLVSGVASDIFIDVFEDGLNVSFALPSGNQSVRINQSLDFIVNTSAEAKIELLINNQVVHTVTQTEQLAHTHTFTRRDDFVVVAQATSGAQIARDTLFVVVPRAAQFDVRPQGVLDGINIINDSTVTFVLYAPRKRNIFVTGDFNNWRQLNDYQMKRDGNYWWHTVTGLDKDRLYRFQYIVDDTIRISDPFAKLVLDPWNDDWINEHHVRFPNIPPYPVGKATGLVATFQINRPQFNWDVPNFQMHPHRNMVIYELLLRDFTVEQSLEAAIARMDYLQYLGITAIKLMPIMEFDGNNSWGYSPNHFFATDKAYGTPEMYKRFINEAHKRGIAVILDIVPNHATGNHPWAMLYWDRERGQTAPDNPFFNVTAPHQWSVFHDFDHSHPKVREHFRRVFQYWTEEFRVDGFRFDLSKGITQGNYQGGFLPGRCPGYGDDSWCQDRIDWLTEYFHAARDVNPNIMFILEHFTHDPEEAELARRGMFLWRNVEPQFRQAAMGWQENSGFGRMVDIPDWRRHWMGYAESHDEERIFFHMRTYGAGNLQTDSIARMRRVPLVMAFATLLPGPKMIWQFGEIGYDVQSGLSGSPIRMQEKPSGFLWFDRCEHRQAAFHASSRILNMRRLHPNAFNYGDWNWQISENDWFMGRRIELRHADLNMIVIGNFMTTANHYGGYANTNPNFPHGGVWHELLTGETRNVADNNRNPIIQLAPGEVRIYTNRPMPIPPMPNIPEPTSVQRPQHRSDVLVYPTLTDGKVQISTNSVIQRVSVFDLHGNLMNVTNNNFTIDLSTLFNGMYFIEIITSEGRTVHRVIKHP